MTSQNDEVIVNSNEPFKHKIHLKGCKTLSSCLRMILFVTVCGNERIRLVLKDDPYFLLPGDKQDYFVDVKNWF